jgi:hypothetical protein
VRGTSCRARQATEHRVVRVAEPTTHLHASETQTHNPIPTNEVVRLQRAAEPAKQASNNPLHLDVGHAAVDAVLTGTAIKRHELHVVLGRERARKAVAMVRKLLSSKKKSAPFFPRTTKMHEHRSKELYQGQHSPHTERAEDQTNTATRRNDRQLAEEKTLGRELTKGRKGRRDGRKRSKKASKKARKQESKEVREEGRMDGMTLSSSPWSMRAVE